MLTAVATLVLALGIGTNTVILAMLDEARRMPSVIFARSIGP